MKNIFELMQSFDDRGTVKVNKFGEVEFETFYYEREFDFKKISYDDTWEYDNDPDKAPKKYTKLVKCDLHQYFIYDGDENLPHKVISWLSRSAIKTGNDKTRNWFLSGINTFLDTKFTSEEMDDIYTYFGNDCNKSLRIEFVKSGYDFNIIKKHQEERSKSR